MSSIFTSMALLIAKAAAFGTQCNASNLCYCFVCVVAWRNYWTIFLWRCSIRRYKFLISYGSSRMVLQETLIILHEFVLIVSFRNLVTRISVTFLRFGTPLDFWLWRCLKSQVYALSMKCQMYAIMLQMVVI